MGHMYCFYTFDKYGTSYEAYNLLTHVILFRKKAIITDSTPMIIVVNKITLKSLFFTFTIALSLQFAKTDFSRSAQSTIT